MPWKEVKTMDQKVLFIADFLRKSWSFKDLCSLYGISRVTGYKWVERYREKDQAERHLDKCGFRLAQPEGWGYFFGKPSGRSERHHYYGDGHISAVPPQRIKTTEDDIFHFAFTWIKNSEHEKGWTIHYRPKHFPLSVEIRSVLKFLIIGQFAQCPEFDFEPCNWRHIEYVQRGDGPFDNNVEISNSWFDEHQQNFTPAIKSLLAAQATMEQVGMGFLPSFEQPEIRRAQEITQRVSKSKPEAKESVSKVNPKFDVAISFAGTERKHAEQLAGKIKSAGFDVFYDGFYPEELWGKNLVEFFHEIYSKRSRYCVIFVLKEYLNREWTIHERRSAQERMLKEKGNEYILPIKVDDVELPGIPATLGYLPIEVGIESISNALLNKLRKK